MPLYRYLHLSLCQPNLKEYLVTCMQSNLLQFLFSNRLFLSPDLLYHNSLGFLGYTPAIIILKEDGLQGYISIAFIQFCYDTRRIKDHMYHCQKHLWENMYFPLPTPMFRVNRLYSAPEYHIPTMCRCSSSILSINCSLQKLITGSSSFSVGKGTHCPPKYPCLQQAALFLLWLAKRPLQRLLGAEALGYICFLSCTQWYYETLCCISVQSD